MYFYVLNSSVSVIHYIEQKFLLYCSNCECGGLAKIWLQPQCVFQANPSAKFQYTITKSDTSSKDFYNYG